jgi:hypothetical protein
MRRRRPRFERRDGVIRLTVPPEERRVLRSLAAQLRELLSADADPDLYRLYPPAYAIYSYLSMVMDQMVQVLLG